MLTLPSASENLVASNQLFARPNLNEINANLRLKGGREFEEAVRVAMEYLDFEASLTETTEAESDVIVEAPHAETPYFIVVECQAVREGGQVGIDKIGQIRGNAASYLDTRRQQLFEEYYKLVVGKPEFSHHAKEKASPDVCLMTVDTLTRLLVYHKRYQISQNVLQEIFKAVGEIDLNKIGSVIMQYLRTDRYNRRLETYSLIYAALLQDPFSDKIELRKKWTPVDQVVAEVLTYGKIFRIRDLSYNEVALLIRDLDNPFIRIVESRRNEIRLSTISLATIKNFSALGEELVLKIRENLEKLRSLKL